MGRSSLQWKLELMMGDPRLLSGMVNEGSSYRGGLAFVDTLKSVKVGQNKLSNNHLVDEQRWRHKWSGFCYAVMDTEEHMETLF